MVSGCQVRGGPTAGSSPHQERSDGSYETIGVTPGGRAIAIVWRYDEDFDPLEDGWTAEVPSGPADILQEGLVGLEDLLVRGRDEYEEPRVRARLLAGLEVPTE